MSRNDRITRKPLLNPGGDSNQTELPHSEEKQYPFVHTTSDAASQEIIAQNNAHGGRPKSSLANGWNFEILSCLLAVVALVGLVVTLWKHENRPLPQWPRIVTINSIISIFTLLIRTGVCFILAEGISQTKWQWFQKPRKLEDMERFDAASRSGWGSFLLLIKVNRRPQ